MEGLIFNIQKYSVNDGGGIRTVVFLKGCPLRCLWCSNPESQEMQPSRIFWSRRCIGCGRCFRACPKGIGNDLSRNAECIQCMACVEACPSRALEQEGKWYTVEEVVQILERDAMFYTVSGGGVTLSGGEPLVQWEFAAELLAECREACMDTAVETSGFAPLEHLEAVAAQSSRILYDVKHMDSKIHQKYTGVGNEQILENLKQIRKSGTEVIVRVPLLHGINDGWKNMEETARYAISNGVEELHLLPFHRYGEPKYTALGRTPWHVDATVPENVITELKEKLSAMGLKIIVGG